MLRKARLVAAASAILLLSASLGPASANPTGTWLTQNGDARIGVAACGNSICGTVVWLRDKIDRATGKPPVDHKNPDPSRRNRPILGLRIFAMAPHAMGGWAGPIYNADDGKTYEGRIFLRSPSQLEVGGCAGGLCGAEMWSRAGR